MRPHLSDVSETDMAPGSRAVRRLVEADPDRDVAANTARAGADIDDVGIGVRDVDGADRAHLEKAVGHVRPVHADVRRSPHTAASAHIEGERLLGDAFYCSDATTAVRADVAVVHGLQKCRVDDGLLGRGDWRGGDGCSDKQDEQDHDSLHGRPPGMHCSDGQRERASRLMRASMPVR